MQTNLHCLVVLAFTFLHATGVRWAAVEANNEFVFPFEINRAINAVNSRFKEVNLNEIGAREIRTLSKNFRLESLLNYNFKSIGDGVKNSSHNISHECVGDIIKVVKAVFNQELWAIRG